MHSTGRDSKIRIAVVGGGAAGFFAAIAAAERNSRAAVTIFEANRRPLNKVRISGGGRCNLTHACFDARELIENYPRGSRALRGVFARFQPRDTVTWFRERGVETKTEADGRMFPVSDDSATIVDCLLESAQRAGVRLRSGTPVAKIVPLYDGDQARQGNTGEANTDRRARWRLELKGGESELFDRVILAAGGSASAFELARQAGHSIVSPAPSIFTFTVKDPRLAELAGLAVEQARVRLPAAKEEARGPVLITHWGLSGPAILRLSAFAARELFAADYRMELRINWRDGEDENSVREFLRDLKRRHGARMVAGEGGGLLPARLWRSLSTAAGVGENTTWAQLSGGALHRLIQEVVGGVYQIRGKGVFKEEFVTAGGVELREVDFRTMQSRRQPGLFLAGEVLDIDGVTGGFNFQSAWSTGWLAGGAAANQASVF